LAPLVSMKPKLPLAPVQTNVAVTVGVTVTVGVEVIVGVEVGVRVMVGVEVTVGDRVIVGLKVEVAVAAGGPVGESFVLHPKPIKNGNRATLNEQRTNQVIFFKGASGMIQRCGS